MGLRSVIASATKTAFDVLGDIPVSATYHNTVWGTFDPDTGTKPDLGSDETVEIVLTEFKRMEMVNEFQSGDRKGIIRQADLTGGIPDYDDYLVISGVTWHIISIASDPADATWTFQLRRA